MATQKTVTLTVSGNQDYYGLLPLSALIEPFSSVEMSFVSHYNNTVSVTAYVGKDVLKGRCQVAYVDFHVDADYDMNAPGTYYPYSSPTLSYLEKLTGQSELYIRYFAPSGGATGSVTITIKYTPTGAKSKKYTTNNILFTDTDSSSYAIITFPNPITNINKPYNVFLEDFSGTFSLPRTQLYVGSSISDATSNNLIIDEYDSTYTFTQDAAAKIRGAQSFIMTNLSTTRGNNPAFSIVYDYYGKDSLLGYYDGTSFVPCSVNYYDGTSFKLCEAYYYNGTQFVNCKVPST